MSFLSVNVFLKLGLLTLLSCHCHFTILLHLGLGVADGGLHLVMDGLSVI